MNTLQNGSVDARLVTSHTLKEYFAVLFRRKSVIVLTFLSVFLSTAYFVQRMEDVYESYSTIVIEEQNKHVDQIMKTNTRSLSFYEGILSSRTFLESLLDSIGMDVFTKDFPKFSRDDALVYIQSNLTLRKTTFSSFLRFNARGKTKELAYLLASVGTDLFRKRCRDVASEESRRAVVEIEKQLQLIRTNLEQVEQDYRRFGEKAGHIQEGTTPELKTLQEAYAKGLAQLGLKEADYEAEKKQLSKLERKITPRSRQRSPEYLKLRAKLTELEKEKLRLEGLGIRLTGLSSVDREIQKIEAQLLEYQNQTKPTLDPTTMRQWQKLRKSVINKEGELELFKRKIESYKKAIRNYKKGKPDILNESLELMRLKRSKEIFEEIYSILLEKAEEERIRSNSSSAGIKIVDGAVMPKAPIPKNETQFYLLGIALGISLGVGLAFLIEINDTTLKSNNDVERYLGLPVLGTIPHIAHNKKNGIKVSRKSSRSGKKNTISQYPKAAFNFSEQDSVITESYRSLRTNLSFASPDNPLQTVVLTSAGPSEGKSLTISNLAMAYAQMGKKTLLIDTDLRRPVLHHIFGMKREPGFSEAFMDDPDYESIIRPTQMENLHIITAGIFTPNPAELIGSQKMKQIIEYFKANFDMVFFDSPPIVAVTDATLLGTKVDGLLMVVKSHHTDREIAQRAMRSLKNVGVKVYGTVLNDIDLSHRYSSYGYYKYYYHYYKTKKD
ncbi:MAG: polysaccharide biosynthesis tyrosine autokinase [Chitinispirillaceae bacterium]